MNENHARRIQSTFAYVDGLLEKIERSAHASGLNRSEFAREQSDLSETEARLLLSVVDSARQRMLATLDHLGLPRPQPTMSARWNVVTALRFIDIALSELTDKELSGYGAIEAGSASEVTAVASELRTLVSRGREVLAPHEGEALRQRLTQLDGPIGDVLRAAEEISTRLGIVEVRPLIAAAADRATAGTIDIGIFGRVSSGKSSLINALIGEPLLPVGATPVTAVPLRVVHGPAAITVTFDDGRRQDIESAQLATYATEAGNPDNVQRVQSILLQSPRLPAGMALLDTPGVGSLRQSGPIQAFAWLPRCDLGVVLVAAGTPLGRDEIALVNGLSHAGIPVDVLFSKSDLLAARERADAIAYVEDEVARTTGMTKLVVRPVSVVPPNVALLTQWRDGELLPLVAERQRNAARSQARRVHAIVAALTSAISNQPAIGSSTLDLHRARTTAEREVNAAANDLERMARPAIESAAHAVTIAWHQGTNGQAAARNALAAPATQALARARSAADSVLAVAQLAGDGELAARLPPLFDPAFLDELPIRSSPSAVDRLFAHAQARRHLITLKQSLDDAYGTYANRLRVWALERIDENFERAASLQAPMDPAGNATAAVPPELRALTTLMQKYYPMDAA